MDYKELIEELRFLSGHVPEEMCDDDGKDALKKAATAIDTLLVEREAAMKYIPKTCYTCKNWELGGCNAPLSRGDCTFDLRKAWEWRVPTVKQEEEKSERGDTP